LITERKSDSRMAKLVVAAEAWQRGHGRTEEALRKGPVSSADCRVRH